MEVTQIELILCAVFGKEHNSIVLFRTAASHYAGCVAGQLICTVITESMGSRGHSPFSGSLQFAASVQVVMVARGMYHGSKCVR